MCLWCFSGTKNGSNMSDDNELNDLMSYACLWLIPRGPNIIEYSIIGECWLFYASLKIKSS